MNQHLENVRSLILETVGETIPKAKPPAGGPQRQTSPWWNEDCQEATHAKPQMEGPLTIHGRTTTSAKEKAEIIAGTFSQLSQSAHLLSDKRQLRLEKEAEFEDPADDNSAPFNSDLFRGS